MGTVSEDLADWFRQHARQYPWRRMTDPYEILVAEIMLQRTRASQVEPVFVAFLREFPSPHKLAEASKRRIDRYFSCLGLRWRASLIKMLARDLVDRFAGIVPSDRNALLSLRAVGDYVADAVLAFAFGNKIAVVDSNVCRIISRVFALEAKGEARRDPRFREIAQSLLPHDSAREFNWAMIDLAALICTPRKPRCQECPINVNCRYYLAEYVLQRGDENN